MVIFNATMEEVSVQAFGNWFTFKPKQIKIMTDNLGQFLIVQRAENGLVGLPPEFEDPEYKSTPAGQEILKAKEAEGIEKFLKKQTEIVNNNLQSLNNDLKMKNIETDSRAFMSDGEMKALETLAKYRQAQQDENHKRIEKAAELQRKLGLK